jgi:hypothetical protein
MELQLGSDFHVAPLSALKVCHPTGVPPPHLTTVNATAAGRQIFNPVRQADNCLKLRCLPRNELPAVCWFVRVLVCPSVSHRITLVSR